MIGRTLLALLVVATAACTNGAEGDVDFARSLDIDLDRMRQTESGLWIEDVREGTGEPAAAGQRVVVHYTGWLPDGTQFDSSRDGQPFDVVIGVGHVIGGWDEGIPGMRPGGRRKLVIPPHLAYGAEGAGRGVIPPNATLVFDVEMIEARAAGAPPELGPLPGTTADTIAPADTIPPAAH
jgi:FKBP-type peptidyl-prolyl cis-trans isomerase FkpA